MCLSLKSESTNSSEDEMTITITQTLEEIPISRIFAAGPK